MTSYTTAPPLRLAGKIAVITGIASGQGRAAAMLFAREGATVIGCDLDLKGAEATVDLIRADGGQADAAHGVDLTNEASVLEWANLCSINMAA